LKKGDFVSTLTIDDIKFDSNGLIPAIAQDHADGTILMVAYMNKESLLRTFDEGVAVYWSRSRQKYWKKGEESGNVQKVKGIYKDCDQDALVIKVEQIGGAACHTGQRSCFYRQAQPDGGWKEISKPVFDPKQVYKK
jgi:phosphoribosyl-AMP cyclohydrolase